MKEITRMEAMAIIRNGKVVTCQVHQNELKKLSTMEDLCREVNFEQKGINDKLKFFVENN